MWSLDADSPQIGGTASWGTFSTLSCPIRSTSDHDSCCSSKSDVSQAPGPSRLEIENHPGAVASCTSSPRQSDWYFGLGLPPRVAVQREGVAFFFCAVLAVTRKNFSFFPGVVTVD